MQYTDRTLHFDNFTAMTNKLALQFRHAAFAICNESSFSASRKIHSFFYDSMDSHVENCANAVLAAKQIFHLQQAFLRYTRKPFFKQLKENFASNNSMLKPVQGQLNEVFNLLSRFSLPSLMK